MLTIGRLEKMGAARYDGAVRAIQQMGEELSFETPLHFVLVRSISQDSEKITYSIIVYVKASLCC